MKHWFITGASSGIGKALSEFVLQKGDRVTATFRKKEEMDAFHQKHRELGRAAQLELKSVEQMEGLIEKVESTIAPIDILVNNAGVGFVGSIEATSNLEAKNLFDINFFGAWSLTKAVLPYMRKRKRGTIVQVSSHGGFKAMAGFGMYNASKFALEAMGEALAQEVAPLGIKVFLVQPGPFRTNFAGGPLLEAAINIEDYAPTATAFSEKLKGIHGVQEGDPAKAAKAIYGLSGKNQNFLRLPLGKVAVNTIQSKLDAVQKDLDTNKELSISCVY